MIEAPTTHTVRPHARPVKIRLTRPTNGLPAGFVMGPMPLHLAELYVKRGAADLIDGDAPTRAKRIDHAPRNKSLAGATG